MRPLRTRRSVRVLLGAILAVFLAILLAVGAAIVVVRRPFPQTAGTLVVPGLNAPVQIVRDRWGIPHVYAESAHDVFFAQGYVHAQERLWQMDFNRRVPSGRLSEIFGEATLSSDRFLRTIGMRRAAEDEWAHLDPETAASLVAYAAGVNAFLARHTPLPIEFLLLRYRPEPWTPVDTLAFARLLAWTLSGNWKHQLLRADLISRFGVDGARVLIPPYPQDAPTVVPEAATVRSVNAAPLLPLLDAPGGLAGIGSNNWAVSGARTPSGWPLLANDPHLDAQMPSVWYEMHLQGGPYNVTGATLPGAPGVVIGHNEQLAWGVTNAGPDVQDLYIERFNPADPTRYLYRGEWVPLTVVREQIRVKGRREPVVEVVRITRHGPVINNVVEGLGAFLAMRWTALDPGTVFASVLHLDRARTWEEFRDALQLWSGPAQNFVYADRKGNIGYQLAGRIPTRANGSGLVPVPGWTGTFEWVGEIPFSRLPSVLNPPRGYIATANNRIAPEGYPYHLTHQWDPGYRARRIETLLASNDRVTVDYMRTMQMDLVSLPGRATVSALADVHLSHEPEAGLLAELRAWDGALVPSSRPAAVYEAFRTALVPLVFKDVLGPDLYKQYVEQPEVWQPVLIRLMEDPASTWWAPRGRDAVVAEALTQAGALLIQRLGPDRSGWSWGRLHRMRFVHPLGRLPALSWVFNAVAPPTGGDLFTVNSGGFALGSFDQVVVASYRQIIDVGDWDRSLSIHTTGQSGLPFHPHYRDFTSLWARGGYHPMIFSRSRVEQEMRTVLRLIP